MKIRLIIFDLDGTLVNSSIDLTNALNYAIAPYGLEILTVEKTISLVGEGITRLIEKVLGQRTSEIGSAVLERFLDYYSAHLSDFSLPYPGVRETLEKLRNYQKAVISNKREDLSIRLLEDLGLAGYFAVVWGSDSVREKKPSPLPVLALLKKLSCWPDEAIMVGDSTYDIEAGKAAGVRTAAVSYGFRDASLLREADFILDNMEELPARLDVLNGG
jgi:phosphoglycolate phosphatase